MKLQLPQIKTRFKVSQDVILRSYDRVGMLVYIVRDLYNIEYPDYGSKKENVIDNINYLSSVDFRKYLTNLYGQIPPYIKNDNGNPYMEYVVPKDTIFSFQRIKWTPNTSYAQVAIKVGINLNKNIDTQWLPLAYPKGWSRPFEEKKTYVLVFEPEEFGKIEFEKF